LNGPIKYDSLQMKSAELHIRLSHFII